MHDPVPFYINASLPDVLAYIGRFMCPMSDSFPINPITHPPRVVLEPMWTVIADIALVEERSTENAAGVHAQLTKGNSQIAQESQMGP